MISAGGHRHLARILALLVTTAGCTSTGYAPLNDGQALVARGGIIELRDEHGTTLPITPDSRVSFQTSDGWTEPVTAGRLCRTERDLAVRISATCADAVPLVPHDAIYGVHVETMDRAATVAVTAAVSAVVLAVLAYAIGGGKSSGSGSGSGSGTASGHGGVGSVSVSGVTAKNGGDGARHGGGRVSAVIDPTGLDLVTRVAVNAALTEPVESPRPVVVDAPSGPAFTDADVRRAELGVLASLDGTASLFGRDGLSSGLHGGVRVHDFVDLGIGLRLVDGGTSFDGQRAVPSVKVGLHGELPRARWAALGLSFEAAHGAAVDLYLDARFGVRFEPMRGFWLGVYPLHPSFVDWSHGRGERWVAQSSLDIACVF